MSPPSYQSATIGVNHVYRAMVQSHTHLVSYATELVEAAIKAAAEERRQALEAVVAMAKLSVRIERADLDEFAGR